MMGIKLFSLSQVFQIPMDSNDFDFLQPMSPLLEAELEGKELSIVDVVVLLHREQLFWSRRHM